jgi:hypothetical protein
MRILLELLRIIFIFAILGSLGGAIIQNLYTINQTTQSYAWLGALAILVLLFVLYRNKLQFSGWYKGKGCVKLPKSVTKTLISVSILLIISPFFMGLVLG